MALQVRIVSKRTLRAFWERHPQAKVPLESWYRIAKRANWRHLADVRETYPHADLAGDLTVFNIKGNDYRLTVQIRYKYHAIYIKNIQTHAECDKESF